MAVVGYRHEHESGPRVPAPPQVATDLPDWLVAMVFGSTPRSGVASAPESQRVDKKSCRPWSRRGPATFRTGSIFPPLM